jgi:hypothetical protein
VCLSLETKKVGLLSRKIGGCSALLFAGLGDWDINYDSRPLVTLILTRWECGVGLNVITKQK